MTCISSLGEEREIRKENTIRKDKKLPRKESNNQRTPNNRGEDTDTLKHHKPAERASQKKARYVVKDMSISR